MPVINRIAAFHPEMTAWRQDFHRHPELGFAEHRTSAKVAELLRGFGVDEVVTGIARTGVVGVIRGREAGAAPGAAIGLRADMDALPIVEETGLPYASATPGTMHACGHDGHTAMLLGAARYLAETRNFAGTVHVIFQPAEEGLAGGKLMVEEGLFERFPMRAVFGMHNWPSGPQGRFLWRAGPIMAACATIDIVVTGRGGHAAVPQATVDPIVVAAHIITALQGIVARSVDPAEAGVVTIGHIDGGHTHNVIPETVRLRGTSRWFSPEVGDLLEAGVRRIVPGIAASLGATAEVSYVRTYIATVNDAEATALTVRAAEAVAGPAQVQHLAKAPMWGEDFAFMLDAKPGSYIMLGAGRSATDANVHHPRYDFNDALLPIGASYWATLAEQCLPPAAK